MTIKKLSDTIEPTINEQYRTDTGAIVKCVKSKLKGCGECYFKGTETCWDMGINCSEQTRQDGNNIILEDII